MVGRLSRARITQKVTLVKWILERESSQFRDREESGARKAIFDSIENGLPVCSRGYCLWMALARRVGVPDVLNRRPFTETLLPVARALRPETSSNSISETRLTLMVVIGGVAPVKSGERFVRV